MFKVVLREGAWWRSGTDHKRMPEDQSFNDKDDFYSLQKETLREQLRTLRSFSTISDLEEELKKIIARKDSEHRVLYGSPYIKIRDGRNELYIGTHETYPEVYLGELVES